MANTFSETKRSKRRKRRALSQHLKKLDDLALQEIHKSMMWSIDTFGGHRCSLCGQAVRPHWQINLSRFTKYGHLTAFGISDKHKCPGEKENWMSKAADRWKRKEKRKQLQPWLYAKLTRPL